MKYRTIKKRIDEINSSSDAQDIINIIDQQLNRLEELERSSSKNPTSKQLRKIKHDIKKLILLKMQVKRSSFMQGQDQRFGQVIIVLPPEQTSSNEAIIPITELPPIKARILTTIFIAFFLVFVYQIIDIDYQLLFDEQLQSSTYSLNQVPIIHSQSIDSEDHTANSHTHRYSTISLDLPIEYRSQGHYSVGEAIQKRRQPNSKKQFHSNTNDTNDTDDTDDTDDEVQQNMDEKNKNGWLIKQQKPQTQTKQKQLNKPEV